MGKAKRRRGCGGGKRTLVIVKADLADLESIVRTARECVIDLRAKGIAQWNDEYPREDILIQDVEKGNLWLVNDSRRGLAMIVLNEDQDDEWGSVTWSSGHVKPLVAHRLMVAPEFQGRGIARMLMDFALDRAASRGHDVIRFDVYSGNPELVATYERMGCMKRGEVFFIGRDLPFYCYELEPA